MDNRDLRRTLARRLSEMARANELCDFLLRTSLLDKAAIKVHEIEASEAAAFCLKDEHACHWAPEKDALVAVLQVGLKGRRVSMVTASADGAPRVVILCDLNLEQLFAVGLWRVAGDVDTMAALEQFVRTRADACDRKERLLGWMSVGADRRLAWNDERTVEAGQRYDYRANPLERPEDEGPRVWKNVTDAVDGHASGDLIARVLAEGVTGWGELYGSSEIPYVGARELVVLWILDPTDMLQAMSPAGLQDADRFEEHLIAEAKRQGTWRPDPGATTSW